MTEICLNFQAPCGKIKPLHGVNNGPVGSARSGTGNAAYFESAGIPFIRNHDASFCTAYGGEFTVDVHRIFRNFDADATKEESYDFEVTDKYVANCIATGAQVFYRLGAAIEHGKKMGTYPPRDYQKWAVICEHIIRHYTEGWKEGFRYPITYWEIWNEPDCQNADGSNPCWQGSWEEFVEFFATALRHLKTCFPHLKIGGPAHVSLGEKRLGYISEFLKHLKAEGLTLDFFSFHRYLKDPRGMREYGERAWKLTRDAGFSDTELILNEWNYVRGWTGENYLYSARAIKGLKGSSLIAGAMCVAQDSPLDMLMYYDARPCLWNGMFDTDFHTPIKGYYPFWMFGALYRMGNYVKPEYQEGPLFCCAATDGEKAGILLTHFDDEDTAPDAEATLFLSGLEGKKEIAVYRLDETRDASLSETLPVTGSSQSLFLTLPLYTTVYLEIRK